jgi:hypothetical protein
MNEPHFSQKALSSESIIDKESVAEKGPGLIDIVRFISSRCRHCSFLCCAKDVIAVDIQAVPEDVLEAVAYARTMDTAEVEEVIHRIVDEVCLPCLKKKPRKVLMSLSEYSTAMTPYVGFEMI